MKPLTFLWASMLLSCYCLAQTKDSLSISVVYHPEPHSRNALITVNGHPVPNTAVASMPPAMIHSVDVSKNDTIVGGHKYSGVVRIALKDGYTPAFISLTDLKTKYTSLQPGPTVFMLDNQLISGDYDRLMVDEKYILKIEVNRLSDADGRQNVNVVKVLTRSEDNIRKSKEIRIRGNASTIVPANYYSRDFRSIDQKLERR